MKNDEKGFTFATNDTTSTTDLIQILQRHSEALMDYGAWWAHFQFMVTLGTSRLPHGNIRTGTDES